MDYLEYNTRIKLMTKLQNTHIKTKSIELFEDIKKQREQLFDEPLWLQKLREERLNAFLKSKEPCENVIEFINNYSLDHGIAKEKNCSCCNIESKLSSFVCESDFIYTIFLNEHLAQKSFEGKTLPNGVILTSIHSALRDFPDLVTPYLQKAYKTKDLSQTANFSLAFNVSGIFLYVPENVVVEDTIRLLFLSDAHVENKSYCVNNLLVFKGESKARVIEEYGSLGDARLFNTVFTKIYAEDKSRLEYYKLQDQNKNTIYLSDLMVEQSKGSKVYSTNVTKGGMVSSENIGIRLLGKETEVNLQGICLLNNGQNSAFNSQIDHVSPFSKSMELYKSVISGKSVSSFRGGIKIHKRAKKSEAFLKNQNLLLSHDATINTLPSLEIYNDDVKCNHGATCGQLDKNALFYLCCRGISEKEASDMLIAAFIQEILDNIEIPKIKEYFSHVILAPNVIPALIHIVV